MAVDMIMIVLSAFGGLCALWTLFGFLLSGHRGGAVVCFCNEDAQTEPLVRRHLWLYNAGLIRCPLLLVDDGLSPSTRQQLMQRGHPIILCTSEELHTLLKQERIHFG